MIKFYEGAFLYIILDIENNHKMGQNFLKLSFQKWGFYMRGRKSKFVLLLIVYFAGFATAIYCLAPVPDNQDCDADSSSFSYSALKSDEFAKSFNSGMHKCLDFIKDTSCQAGDYIKQKIKERKIDS